MRIKSFDSYNEGGEFDASRINSIDVKDIKFIHRNEGMFDYEYIDIPLISAKNSAIIYRTKKYAGINNGNPILELHISLHPDLQRKGLAAKAIKAFLKSRRGKDKVFYLCYDRIVNKYVYGVIEKLKSDRDLSIVEYEDGVTVQLA